MCGAGSRVRQGVGDHRAIGFERQALLPFQRAQTDAQICQGERRQFPVCGNNRIDPAGLIHFALQMRQGHIHGTHVTLLRPQGERAPRHAAHGQAEGFPGIVLASVQAL